MRKSFGKRIKKKRLDSEDLFLHELALVLGRRVPEIKSWPHEEVLAWFEYLERRPLGWREDLRTHYLLSAQGVKAKPHEVFSSLHAIERDKEEVENESVQNDAAKLIASGFFSKMVKDTGWDIELK